MLTTAELFAKFLQTAKGKNRAEVLQLAQRERYPYAVAGKTIEARRPKIDYEALLGGLLFFLRYGMKPLGISEWDFQLFRPLCEDLVQNKHLPPEVMGMFAPGIAGIN
jgi:hypothetical protein